MSQPTSKPPSPHPDIAQLRAYSLGRLGDGESRLIERHVMSCPACKENLFEIPASDEFVDWLQKVHRERHAADKSQSQIADS